LDQSSNKFGLRARLDVTGWWWITLVAASSHEKALALTQQKPERQFLQERIRQLG
jgi:RNA polymerase sigma-70 factor (ECF subfamily)